MTTRGIRRKKSSLSEVKIAVIGAQGVGKSGEYTTITSITKNLFLTVSNSIFHSCKIKCSRTKAKSRWSDTHTHAHTMYNNCIFSSYVILDSTRIKTKQRSHVNANIVRNGKQMQFSHSSHDLKIKTLYVSGCGDVVVVGIVRLVIKRLNNFSKCFWNFLLFPSYSNSFCFDF